MIPVVEFFIRSPPDPGPSPTATPANPGPRKAVSGKIRPGFRKFATGRRSRPRTKTE